MNKLIKLISTLNFLIFTISNSNKLNIIPDDDPYYFNDITLYNRENNIWEFSFIVNDYEIFGKSHELKGEFYYNTSIFPKDIPLISEIIQNFKSINSKGNIISAYRIEYIKRNDEFYFSIIYKKVKIDGKIYINNSINISVFPIKENENTDIYSYRYSIDIDREKNDSFSDFNEINQEMSTVFYGMRLIIISIFIIFSIFILGFNENNSDIKE